VNPVQRDQQGGAPTWQLYGHVGADVFMGKGGSDFIDAADGQRDAAIICGGGDDDISVDRADPDPAGC